MKTYRHPLLSIINHGLIKLLVQRALAQNNQTWEQFVVGARVNRAPIVRGIEVGYVKQSSSYLAMERGKALEGLGNVQAKISGEVVAAANPIEEMARVVVVEEESILLVVGAAAEAVIVEAVVGEEVAGT